MASILQKIPGGFTPTDFNPAHFQSYDQYGPWRPRWHVTLTKASVPRYFSTASSDRDPTRAYRGVIAEGREPTIQSSMSDPVFRLQETETTRFGLANAVDPLTGVAPFTADYVADFRGALVEIDRWDEETGYELGRFVGTVTHSILEEDVWALEARNLKREVLEDEIPKQTITTTLFPDARPESLGQVIPIIFGDCTNVPLYCIRDDMINSVFLYLGPLASGGGSYNVNALRRTLGEAFESITPAEYTIDRSGASYPGYTVLRMLKRQQQWGSDGLLTLVGDFSTAGIDRNPARARFNVLTQPWAGLNQPVDIATFQTAEAVLAADLFGEFRIDGALIEKRSAQEVLGWLGQCRGLMLGLNRAGQWTESVDVPRTVSFALRDGPGDGTRNLEECRDRQRRPDPDRVKRIVFSYRRDLVTNIYRGEQTMTPDDVGRDLPIENPMISDHVMAAKTLRYIYGRIKWGEETVQVSALQDVRAITIASLVSLTYAKQAYTNAVMEVVDLTDGLTQLPMKLQGGTQALYDAIYFYDVETPLPTDPGGGFATDYSRTVPFPATSLQVISHWVDRNAAGQDVAAIRLQWTAPSDPNFSASIPRYRLNGETAWTPAGPIIQAGAGVQVRLSGLVTAAFYDFSIQTVNLPGNLTSTPSVVGEDIIYNVQVAVDQTPPTITGSTLTATAGLGAVIDVVWPAPPEMTATGDYSETYVHASTNPADFTDANPFATVIGRITGTKFVHLGMTLGVPWYYRIRHQDYSGNTTTLAASPQDDATATAPPAGTTRPTPARPANPGFVTDGTYQGSDGKTWAFITVSIPAMPTDGYILEIGARPHNAGNWTTVAQYDATTALASGNLRIDGGVPGQQYDISAIAWNGIGQAGQRSSDNPTVGASLLTLTAPGDITVPPQVTQLTVRQTGAKVIEIVPTGGTTPPDFAGYRYFRNASDSHTGVTQIAGLHKGRITDTDVIVGQTWYYFAEMVDFTGNVSAIKSPKQINHETGTPVPPYGGSTTHFLTVRRIQSGDIDDNGVPTPKIPDGNITNPKIQGGAVTTLKRQAVHVISAATGSIGPNTGSTLGPIAFSTYGLAFSTIPLMVVDSGNPGLVGWLSNISLTQFNASVYNVSTTTSISATYTVYFW